MDTYHPPVTQYQTGPAWRARTVAIPDPGTLSDLLAEAGGIAWLRRGDGVIGFGEAERASVSSLAEADAWWTDLAGRIEHETELPGIWGTGPLAFGSFVFDAATTASDSVMVVPQVIVGRRGDTAWLTTLSRPDAPRPAEPAPSVGVRCPGEIQVLTDATDEAAWVARVAQVVERLADPDGGLDKVVLARAVRARAAEPIDPRWLVRELAERYPSTWVFHVDGLVGASPEMLIRRQGGLALSRVLAGTIQRGDGRDETLEAALARSEKDQAEHEYAVASVAGALAPFCSGMNVPESPYVLRLPNVMHLASDVTGVVDPRMSSLALAAHLHPSAAVCGTPTPAARAAIAATEGLDRGRYSGPVGWIDTSGDGEWAIALRCGQFDPADPRAITLYAGCGIVEQSEPDAELAETHAKLVPMLSALGACEA